MNPFSPPHETSQRRTRKGLLIWLIVLGIKWMLIAAIVAAFVVLAADD